MTDLDITSNAKLNNGKNISSFSLHFRFSLFVMWGLRIIFPNSNTKTKKRKKKQPNMFTIQFVYYYHKPWCILFTTFLRCLYFMDLLHMANKLLKYEKKGQSHKLFFFIRKTALRLQIQFFAGIFAFLTSFGLGKLC